MFNDLKKDYRPLLKEDGDSAVANDDSNSEQGLEPLRYYSQESKLLPRSRFVSTLLLSISASIIFSVGIVLGLLVARSSTSHPSISLKWLDDSISIEETVFHYNKTFAKAPSPIVETAWQSIFPKGRGFIQDPVISPNVSGLAVFHELHCLVAIHNALYESQLSHENMKEGGSSPVADSESQPNGNTSHTDMHHVRHCFDYLRQSLMCHADTNLEPVDWAIGGVTGWGSKRICRSYADVVKLANRLRTHNQTDVS